MAQSALLSQFDLHAEDNRDFEPDLRRLMGLDDAIRRELLEHLAIWVLQPHGDVRAREFATQASAPKQDVLGAVRCYDFFLRKLVEPDNEDTPEQWAADLAEALELSEADAERVGLVLVPLADLPLASVRRELARRQPGVLPEFLSIDTSIELRAVFDESFALGDALPSYRPRVQDLVPVVSVALDTTSESALHLQFYLDELHLVVEKLQAAVREAEALETVVQPLRQTLQSPEP